MQDTTDIISGIETAILMLLEAQNMEAVAPKIYPPGLGVRIEDMYPNSSYVAGLDKKEGKVYIGDPHLLSAHPAEILGEEIEACAFDDRRVGWYGFRRVKKLHKKATCEGKPSHFYEMHQRYFTVENGCQYRKRILAFNKNGELLPITVNKVYISHPLQEGWTAIPFASVIEHAHRVNTVLVSVKDAAEIKFPVHLDSYKEIFAIRDSPLTDSGKRKAIVHWVSEHLRKTSKGTSTVKEHTRGAVDITIAGLHISLKPNPRL